MPGRRRLGLHGVRASLTGTAAATARFAWAVGIEDTFVPQLARRTGRVLDEYDLTQHYRFWREDLDRVASLGITQIRYGIPWYRVEPARGRFDWSWTDQVIPYLVETLRIEPILDLMHYGCPLWLEREFINPAYPERVAEYAAAVADRYGDLVHHYTPLNEPRVNAYFCGQVGLWPPYLRGRRGYARVLVALARGMSLTVEALRSRRPDAVIVHVEAGSRVDTEDPALQPEVAVRLEQQFLAAELQMGRVDEQHPMWDWLVRHGIPPPELAWFVSRGQSFDIAGVNFYPQFNCWRIIGTPERPARKQRYGTREDLEAVLTAHHQRFSRPVMLTETSEKAPVRRRERWLEQSVLAVRNSRAEGVPVVGYVWFPAYSLVAWTYRRGSKTVAEYLYHMGLWDLREDGSGRLERVPTRLVDRFARLASDGLSEVGDLMVTGRSGLP